MWPDTGLILVCIYLYAYIFICGLILVYIYMWSGKGNSIVIVDRVKYIEKMENFLSDQSKFQKITVKDDNFLNFITSQEKRIDKIYKKLVDSNSMSEETRTSGT